MMAPLPLFLALVLAVSAAHKAQSGARFATATARLAGVSPSAGQLLLVVAAAAEAIAALCLVIPAATVAGALIAALLWSAYALALWRRRGETLDCGSLRRAGNGGWYWEVNRLSDISDRIVPFFDRFPLVGQKARDYQLFRDAVALLSKPVVSDADYVAILQFREQMNRGGKMTLLDSENPQRLYADLSDERGEMR